MGARLALETSAARLVGRLSRAAGRGGGTTLPGKLVWKLDPGALDALAARLPQGVALVSATNGKTTTTAMASAILAPDATAWPGTTPARTSPRASPRRCSRRDDADLGLLEVDEFALPEVMRRSRPRVVCLGNLFRDQLDRYGELEHIAERWRAAVAALAADTRRSSPTPTTRSSPPSRTVGTARCSSASTTRGARARGLQHASDSKYCVRCGHPYRYDAAYVGHLGAYRCESCGHARPALDVAARAIEPDGLEGVSFVLHTPHGQAGVRLAVPGLYNVYNALAAASLALTLGVPLDESRRGARSASRAAFGRFERFSAGDRQRAAAARQEPGGRQRGAPDARGRRRARERSWSRSTTGSPTDATSPGSGTSTSSRVLEQAERIVVSGERAAELGAALHLRRLSRSTGSRSSPTSRRRSTAGSS